MTKRGFTAVPKCLITCAGELKLRPQEAMVLFNIIERYWYANDDIYPRIKTIAQELGMGSSTVRGHIKSLERKGLLKTTQRFNTSSLYELRPLMDKLSAHLENCPKMHPEMRGERIPSSPLRSKSSAQERSDSSVYIENYNYLETNKDIEDDNMDSQRFTSEDDDDTALGGYAAYMLDDDGHCFKHDWETWDTIKKNRDGDDVYIRYKTCNKCGGKIHYNITADEARLT
jgi:DNA-binding MarR family transcriptional regulator